NVYQPSPIRPHAGDTTPWLEFMDYLIPNPEDRKETLRWCATLIACPHIRMHYGLLLVSETRGIGKATLAEILACVVGARSFTRKISKRISHRQLGALSCNVKFS